MLGLPNACLAEVEQGDLERDREPAVADVFAGLLVLGELVGVARVQNVDESGRVGEAVGLGKRVKLNAGNLQVDAAAHGLLLDLRQGERAFRQGWQRFRKGEFKIVAPEAKRAHQTLAFPRGALLCTGETNRDVGMECLLARLIELVHCAGLAEALGELRHRFGSLVGLGEKANCLLRRDCAIEGTARFGRDAQRLKGGCQLRLTKTFGCDFAAHRKRGKGKNTGDDLALDSVSTEPVMRVTEKCGLGGSDC